MTEHDNDNISQFFHKAVRKPQISFVESDWEKLEARLDEASATGEPKPNRWKTAFMTAAVLFFVSSALLLYTGQTNTIAKKTAANKINAAPISNSTSSENKKPSGEKQQPRSTEEKKPDERTTPYSLLSKVMRKGITGRGMNSSEENYTALQNNVAVDKAAFQDAAPSDQAKNVSAMNQSSDKEVSSQPLPGDSSSAEEPRKQKDKVKSKMSLTDSVADPLRSTPSRWNVMLSLSPDFSSTGLHKFTTPGEAFGIAAYYHVSHTFSISAGVVKSSKHYWDNGNQYKPVEAGFWGKKTNGIVPGKVEGSCSVLEIPIGLQYNMISTKKNNLYLAASFSSYIMLRESYQYIFDSPNPGAMESWNAKKTSYSLFSIANLAAGYERSISDRMMIGMSPYIKIPMSGIGAWANVKLYSIGAAFTLRYQLLKKKKPDRLTPAD